MQAEAARGALRPPGGDRLDELVETDATRVAVSARCEGDVLPVLSSAPDVNGSAERVRVREREHPLGAVDLEIADVLAVRLEARDEIIDERSERNSEFTDLVDAALRRRQLLRELATRREKLGLSQTLVAARMGTSQSAVARLEAGEIDAKLSTVERFAAALGQRVEWRVAKTSR